MGLIFTNLKGVQQASERRHDTRGYSLMSSQDCQEHTLKITGLSHGVLLVARDTLSEVSKAHPWLNGAEATIQLRLRLPPSRFGAWAKKSPSPHPNVVLEEFVGSVEDIGNKKGRTVGELPVLPI